MPLGAQCGQVLATDQPAVGEQREQDEQVGGQVGQLAVAPGVLLPARADALLVVAHPRLPPWEVRGQWRLLLGVRRERPRDEGGIVLAAGVEAVDLAAQAGLAAVNAPGVQKHRAAHLANTLLAQAFLHHGGGDQRAHPPVKAQHPALRGQRRDLARRHIRG